jgi:GNAT superfamily N-acetyltransferase
MVWKFEPRAIRLLRLAVHPEHRRQGYGRAMLERIVSKLHDRRTHAIIDVPGELLHAHLWLKACGWVASPLVGKDEYRFTITITREGNADDRKDEIVSRRSR